MAFIDKALLVMNVGGEVMAEMMMDWLGPALGQAQGPTPIMTGHKAMAPGGSHYHICEGSCSPLGPLLMTNF